MKDEHYSKEHIGFFERSEEFLRKEDFNIVITLAKSKYLSICVEVQKDADLEQIISDLTYIKNNLIKDIDALKEVTKQKVKH
jgi:hypothetical protein